MVLPTLPRLPRTRDEQRPPRLSRPPVLPTGPKLYGLGKKPRQFGGPGDPPAGFVGATNSASEWKCLYWPLSQIMGTPANPRVPPFFGGEGWQYQTPYLGGNDVLGGSIIDAVVFAGMNKNDPLLPFEDVGIFLDTERFHVFTSSKKQAADVDLKVALSHILRVETLFEQDVLGDESGQSAIQAIKRLLAGTAVISPITGGTARRVRT